MKKILVIVALVSMFMVTKVNAQEFRFGAKAGINFANLTDDADGDMRTVFHLGAVAAYKVNEQLTIQPELLFSAQGAKADDSKAKLSYLNVPVMFKYYVAEGFNLQAGPQIGFLLDSELENGSLSVDADEAFKTIDFGLNFGLGYDINENIFIEGRYNWGLSDIVKEQGKAKNSVFQISVGYMF